MKSKLNAIAIVAVAYFLLVCGFFGILKASGFVLFSLFGVPHHNSPAQEFIFDLVGVLTYPTDWLAALLPLPANSGGMILLMGINSAIGGVCLGLPIHGFRQRHQRHAG